MQNWPEPVSTVLAVFVIVWAVLWLYIPFVIWSMHYRLKSIEAGKRGIPHNRPERNTPIVEWLTPEQVKSGEYDGWLPVQIEVLALREASNGSDFIYLVYSSLDEQRQWKLQQNYFALGDNNRLTISLAKVTGLGQLHHDNMHELFGKQLEVRVSTIQRTEGEYVDVISHRRLAVEDNMLEVG